MLTYDEGVLGARLARLGRSARTAFAASCAQRLWPLYRRYAALMRPPHLPTLAAALDDVWTAVDAGGVDLAAVSATAELMVPDEEDPDWVHESAYAQNAVASIAYAAESWRTDAVQQAVWAARQVYEAADHAAQAALPALDLNSPDAEATLLGHPVVQTALAGIARDLDAVESGVDWVRLRADARRDGQAWCATLP